MSEKYGQLSVEAREQSGKGVARKLRANGLVPAVIYGQGKDSRMVTVDPSAFRKAMDPERRLNTFFELKLEGSDVVESCVVADYQIHSTRDDILHLDFLRVDENTEVTTSIPVEYGGRPVGVVAGGKLRTYRRSVRVAAKPKEVPVKLNIDLSALDAGQSLRLKELSLENARLLDHPETVMAHVDPPRAAKEDKADS